ncbi:MAG: N-formylglutamate amidohydrolase [Pseudomonadota bacterium]
MARLATDGAAVVRVVNPEGQAPVCLVCEHASAHIPPELGDLGLAPRDRMSHAAYDIGAEALSLEMSRRLHAPLVLAGVSRLVQDLNRPPEARGAMPDQVETIAIPGNRDLSPAARLVRVEAVYDPFHTQLSEFLDRFTTPPALVTIHSFTPVWHGTARPTEIGLLHDDDPRLARAMQAAGTTGFRVDLNEPYSAADGVTHLLNRHGTARGLANVMIEVRNDLLGDAASIDRAAGALMAMLTPALAEVQTA